MHTCLHTHLLACTHTYMHIHIVKAFLKVIGIMLLSSWLNEVFVLVEGVTKYDSTIMVIP